MGAQAPQRIYTSFCTGAAGLRPLLRCNIVPEFIRKILPVVKKQRQKVQCGKKTTANFALRVNPIRESPYVVFLQNLLTRATKLWYNFGATWFQKL